MVDIVDSKVNDMVYMVNNLVTSLLVMMMMMMMSSAWVTRLECPKGVKDEFQQARRAKRVAEGHQLEIRAQRAPRFLVFYILYFIFSIEY